MLVYSYYGSLFDNAFKYQITKAVISISNNLAEGLSGRSNKDLNRFLIMALGSCNEVKSMIYLSSRLSYIDQTKTAELLNACNEAGRVTRGLQKSISLKHEESNDLYNK